MTIASKRASSAETFPAIDVLKFLFAILILCLHGGIFKGSQFGVFFERTIVRLAVPFFFVSSGFFYGRKVYAKNDLGPVTKNYVSRLAVKLLVFEPVSIVILFVQEIALYHQNVSAVIRESIRGILFYPQGALWYIQAVIVAVLLLVPFLKRGREKMAFRIGLALYPFALLCNRYYFLCEGTVLEPIVTGYMRCFISARNGVFMGLLYVSMGVLMARKWDDLKQKGAFFFVLTLVSGLGLMTEVYLTNSKSGMDDNALFLAHLLFVPALFICAGKQKISWLNSCINTSLLRNLSTSIYLLHRPITRALKCGSLLLRGESLEPWPMTLITSAIVALMCTVLYWKKWNPFYNWIK